VLRGRNQGFLDLWPHIAQSENAGPSEESDALLDAADELANLISPTLAAYVLSGVQEQLDGPVLEAKRVSENRLLAKFSLSQQRHWAKILAGSEIDVVFLKGFANGHSFYPDPILRQQGDLDFLIRKQDLQAAIDCLTPYGFGFRSAPLSRWGAISDASFMPFVTADGSCDLDIHVHPDCYPAYCSLTTERLFAESRLVDAGGFVVRIPSREHALLLCVTNTAKDKFDVFSIRKVIDAMELIRATPNLDWEKVIELASEGNFLMPTRVFFSLLVSLGFPPTQVPDTLLIPLPRWRRKSFGAVVRRFRCLFPGDPYLLPILWREWTLCAEPTVAFYNLWLRAKGILKPGTGIPECAPMDDRKS
jgi:hypothetical protein